MVKNYLAIIVTLILIGAVSGYTSAQNYADTTHQHDQGMRDDQSRMQDHTGLSQAIEEMYTEITGTSLTGNHDADFAHLMAHHHEGAIKMSELVIENGRDLEVQNIARKVIEESQRDLEELRRQADMGNVDQFRDDQRTTDDQFRDDQRTTDDQFRDDQRTTDDPYRDDQRTTDDQYREETTDDQFRDDQRTTDDTYRDPGVTDDRFTGQQDTGLMEGLEEMLEEMRNMQLSGNIDQDYAKVMKKHNKQSIKLSENYISLTEDGNLVSLAEKIIENSEEDLEELENYTD
jgi:uncharacterized protein (DUF305 family)